MAIVVARENIDMHEDVADRLYSKIEVLDNGCWRFTGGINGRGYGNFWMDGTTRSAHVVSFELHKGLVPNGLNILHSCDYKPCINPDHLFSGTTQDNIDDMISKERDRFRGVQNGRSILNWAKVKCIRRLLAHGITQDSLGKVFGVSRGTIAGIKSYRLWNYV